VTAPPLRSALDLSGTVVVVTGASGNIGGGIARRFHEAGASVVLHHLTGADRAGALAAELGERVLVHGADLSSQAGAEAVAAAAVGAFGRLDTWVANAGIQPVQELLAIGDDDLAAMLDAHVGSVHRSVRAAAPHLAAAGGSVVTVASIEGLQPAPGHAHYAAAKAAVLGYTRAAAGELGQLGVRVNAVAPGLVARPGIEDAWPEGVARWQAAAPLGRLGEPADVADACLFLASPLARWITGATLVVDGGVLARPTW
jgi:NAD(P)-dependent dehydrogenase (short-subunit alcohol dehydrogenase family)